MAQEYRKGTMKVELKTEEGMTLTKEHGFRVQEESGKVLNFDLIAHPEYGHILMFADGVCMLSFWTDEQLEQARDIVNTAVDSELARRK